MAPLFAAHKNHLDFCSADVTTRAALTQNIRRLAFWQGRQSGFKSGGHQFIYAYVCVRACVCVCARVRACAGACVHACVRACSCIW